MSTPYSIYSPLTQPPHITDFAGKDGLPESKLGAGIERDMEADYKRRKDIVMALNAPLPDNFGILTKTPLGPTAAQRIGPTYQEIKDLLNNQ